MNTLLSSLYQLAWKTVLPILHRSPRIAEGWDERTLTDDATGPYDIWIQSASGGEAMLSCMVLEELAASAKPDTGLRILVTSTTPQGVSTLSQCIDKVSKSISGSGEMKISVRFFPFDSPHLMKKAFARFAPRLIVLLETELWPALLKQAKYSSTPVLLINGRISKRSFPSYKRMKWLFAPLSPTRILAVSRENQERFSQIIDTKDIGIMNNIKFDRINPSPELPDTPKAAELLPEKAPFVLLGSVRKEEEPLIVAAIPRLLARRPDIVIGLFPKHLERAPSLLTALEKCNIRAVLRSSNEPVASGAVVVWDSYGELASAYSLAHSAFIGGSLVDLGGQNFLEPLVFGLKPVIGPYWSNFSWVSREIIEAGLVYEVADQDELVDALLNQLTSHQPRAQVIAEVERFLAPRKGGSRQAAKEILTMLNVPCREDTARDNR